MRLLVTVSVRGTHRAAAATPLVPAYQLLTQGDTQGTSYSSPGACDILLIGYPCNIIVILLKSKNFLKV